MKICIIINYFKRYFNEGRIKSRILVITSFTHLSFSSCRVETSLIVIHKFLPHSFQYYEYFWNVLKYFFIYIRLSFFYEAKLRGIIFSRISRKAFEILKIPRDSEKQKHFHLTIRHKNCRFSSWCFICPLFSGKCDIVAMKKFKRGRMQFVYLYALE